MVGCLGRRAMAYETMKEKFLLRGFTSIRDIGGAELGLLRALKAGVISGPRMWAAGPTISQTAGLTKTHFRYLKVAI